MSFDEIFDLTAGVYFHFFIMVVIALVEISIVQNPSRGYDPHKD